LPVSIDATPRRFKKGDVLFREGDASDCVLRVRSGEIEVLREVGDASVLLGRVKAGEWLGEMGVIENRVRSATARAATDGDVEILTAGQFLDRISSDAALARDLILRLSIRLRSIEDKIAGDLVSFSHGRSVQRGGGAADSEIAADAGISLAAETDMLRAQIGAAPIVIGKLPFVVGRAVVADEAPPLRRPDLVLEDQEPFRLSRQHFMIVRGGGHLMVSDLGSTLGTLVNGQPIGHHFTKDTASLHRGDNQIIAGGWDSPFAFSLVVD
jgi:CRP/FNR family transcriptional regulator, cyclic AMP receptor protein